MSQGEIKNANGDIPKESIDEGLYSRQLLAIGKEAMVRMGSSKVLISGMGGLGIEIAKNLVLMGISEIVLHDDSLTTREDLSSQFYLGVEDIGKNRATQSLTKLRRLNPNVKLTTKVEPITIEALKDFQLVIFTEWLTVLNIDNYADFCHKNGVMLILSECRGPFCRVFCDFGKNFVVLDSNEIEPEAMNVRHITNEEFGLVTCLVEKSHGLQVGDIVSFNGVQGMKGINNKDHLVTKLTSSDSFCIGNTKDLENFISNPKAMVTKKVVPKIICFRSLQHALLDPQFANVDFSSNPATTHLAFLTAEKMFRSEGTLPRSNDPDKIQKFIETANSINNSMKHKSCYVKFMDPKLLEDFYKTCTAHIGPVAAFLGGVVAQEAVKACTQKFTPLSNFLICDFSKCIPKTTFLSTQLDVQLDRYSGSMSFVGSQLQNKLMNLKVFVVGAGAIGCEVLKNLAMMGVGTGENGYITVTDMDCIEKSNLSRQFLFQAKDIGNSKSATAKEAVFKMNPHVKVNALQVEVGPGDEKQFGHEFFRNLDCVINALDNVAARKYIDEKCVDNKIPLLESGTQGLKGSTQIIVPNITKCYRDTQDPPPQLIPMCTLKLFPYRIEHTIQWARDLFQENFKNRPVNACDYIRNGYQKNDEDFTSIGVCEKLSSIRDFFSVKPPTTFSDCIKFALLKYQEIFVNEIKDIVSKFPQSHLNSTGQLFWSGTKRFPKPYEFDVNDELCLQFILYAANLHASVFRIVQSTDKVAILSALTDLQTKNMSESQTKRSNTIKYDNVEEENIIPNYSDKDYAELVEDLPEITESLKRLRIEPQEFEKDDDTNFHIDFIEAASNLRAKIYSIETVDRLKTKQIAGKIIPAIATTTSVAAGLICLELYKLFDDQNHDIKRFCDGFVNLALPMITLVQPKRVYCETDSNGFTWSIWQRPEIQGDVTLNEFLILMQTNYKIHVSVMSFDVHLLYMEWLPDEEKLQKTITKLIEEATGLPIDPEKKELSLIISSSEAVHKDINIPPVRYLVF